jgi:hypothetical protein
MSERPRQQRLKRRRQPSNQFAEQTRAGYDDTQRNPGTLSELHIDVEDIQQNMVKLNTKEQSTERKVELLSAIVSKQHSLITSMKTNILDLSKRSLMNEFVILNLREAPRDQTPVLTIVKQTLNTMGITEQIDYEYAYRRGPPREDPNAAPRPVIVRLNRRDAVDRILKGVRSRKFDKTQPRIVPHLPEELRQNRVKLGLIAHKKFLADSNAKIKVKSDHVQVNGVKIKDNIQPVTPNETLFLDKDKRASIQYVAFTCTDIVTCKNSNFQLFHTDVPNLNQCRLAHQAIATIPSVAAQTHLISAYSLITGEFGWQDDGDHGLGKFLYQTMVDRELQNCICFVSRDYGGIHINKKRFEIIQQLVDEVIINAVAPEDKYGNIPYLVSPPPMTLPHPSTMEQWIAPRKTVQAARKTDNSDKVSVPAQRPPTDRDSDLLTVAPRDTDEHSSYHTDQTSQHSGSPSRMEEEKSDLDTTIKQAPNSSPGNQAGNQGNAPLLLVKAPTVPTSDQATQ